MIVTKQDVTMISVKDMDSMSVVDRRYWEARIEDPDAVSSFHFSRGIRRHMHSSLGAVDDLDYLSIFRSLFLTSL